MPECSARNAIRDSAAQATLKWLFDQFRRAVAKAAIEGVEKEAKQRMLRLVDWDQESIKPT